MPSSRRDTKARILSAAYRLIYREGFARVSLDAIAAETGVTKRTLYYHFDSKDALVAAMLEDQRRHVQRQIARWGTFDAQHPADVIGGLFAELDRWVAGPDWLGSGFTRLTMELADLPGHPARRAAKMHKQEVETWLAQALEAAGAHRPQELARQVQLLFEGAMALTLIHGDRTYLTSAASAANRLAAADESAPGG